MTTRFLIGDVFERLAEIPDGSVDLVLTSPPFLALRSYLPDGHPDKAKEIGSEATPAEFLDVLLAMTAELARVLAPHGSIAIELGDTYCGAGGYGSPDSPNPAYGADRGAERWEGRTAKRFKRKDDGWPLDKSLCGIPTLYAWSLAYGRNLLTGEPSPAGMWRIRTVKPWIRCLDIDTAVYVRTPTGDRPMRLLHLHQQFAPGKFQVWNGEQWTPVVATQPSTADDAIEIEFRTGERIACTREHRWPIQSILGTRKILRADELTVGDIVPLVQLPGPDRTEPPGLPDDDIGWLCGVYLGDGSFDSKDRIQIAGHKVLDAGRAARLERIAADYDGTSSVYEHGNTDGGNRGNVVLRSRPLAAVIRQYIGGKNARSKHLQPAVWRRSDAFLRALLMGYLESDGHYDEQNDRWRLGFTDNPWLARDLRTIAARLGVSCILKRWRAGADPRGGNWAGSATHRYRGEIRFKHRTSSPAARGEIVAIRKTQRRSFIDVAVADDPHTFALASGILTHNSNPPVGALGDKERPATSYVIVATRARDRYFDLDAVRTATVTNLPPARGNNTKGSDDHSHRFAERVNDNGGAPPRDWWHQADAVLDACLDDMAGARGVHLRRALERAGILQTLEAVDVSPKGYSGAHYAVWPPELVRLLVAEMCPHRVCTTCGKPSRRITSDPTYIDGNGNEVEGKVWASAITEGRGAHSAKTDGNVTRSTRTVGWSDCGHGTWRPGLVLDPFAGSGTTLAVVSGMGRDSIGIDLDERNADLARERVGMFLEIIDRADLP